MLFLHPVRWVRGLLQSQRMMDTLDGEMDELLHMVAEVRDAAVDEEDGVRSWMGGVDSLADEVAGFQNSLSDPAGCCLGLEAHWGWCWSTNNRRAADIVERAASLKRRGELILATLVAAAPAPDRIRPSWEVALGRVMGYLKDDRTGSVGIYGMGGVGKTFLLRRIRSELHPDAPGACEEFSTLVIWVALTADWAVLKLQKEIGDQVGLPFPFDDGENGGASRDLEEEAQIKRRAELLSRTLSGRRFLLLLDDVWERVDLERIGIPVPDGRSKSKIVFTTRSEAVCCSMAAEQVRLNCLTEAESWELFRKKVRVDIDASPSILPLAQQIVGRCGGLPLALEALGRAMADAWGPKRWGDEINRLEKPGHRLRGMEHAFSRLKSSFDRLPLPLQSCFLYCALFPEEQDMSPDHLVELWLGEGFLDDDYADTSRLDIVRQKGHEVIAKLQSVCLLDGGDSDGKVGGKAHVRMHRVLRQLALWLTDGKRDSSNLFLVRSGLFNVPAPAAARWMKAKRASFVDSRVKEWPEGCHCPNLQTLLLFQERERGAQRSLGFGMSWSADARRLPALTMPSLRVLDLSYSWIFHLPASIGSLRELRHLDLTCTNIKSLPKELGRLEKLRYLNLAGTSSLKRVPRESISTLTELRVLNFWGSSYHWGWQWDAAGITTAINTPGKRREKQGGKGHANNEDEEEEAGPNDLEALVRLEELGLCRITPSWLTLLASSHHLSLSTRSLHLYNVQSLVGDHLSSAFRAMVSMRWLIVSRCTELERLSIGAGELPCLEYLGLSNLGLETVDVAVTGGGGGLSSLRTLHVESCRGLGFQDLTWAGRLPCLEELSLSYCNETEVLGVVAVDVSGSTPTACDVQSSTCDEGRPGAENPRQEADPWFPKLRVMELEFMKKLKSIITPYCLLRLPSLEVLVVESCPRLKSLPLGRHSAKNLKQIRGSQRWWDSLVWADDQEATRSVFSACFTHSRDSLDWGEDDEESSTDSSGDHEV